MHLIWQATSASYMDVQGTRECRLDPMLMDTALRSGECSAGSKVVQFSNHCRAHMLIAIYMSHNSALALVSLPRMSSVSTSISCTVFAIAMRLE